MLKLFIAKHKLGRNFLIDSDTFEVIEVEAIFSDIQLPPKNEVGIVTPAERKEVTKIVDKIKSVKNAANDSDKRWSRKYDCCQECLTTKRPHESKGLCRDCYQKQYKAGKAVGAPKRGRKPKAEHKNKFECLDCMHEFESLEDFGDAQCPKCESKKLVQK